ncbi:tyrosine recombinase XerC [bacterium]|nr:tyrosine recombinase XerC [bacterium]
MAWNMPIEDALDSFHTFLRVEKNLSPRTREAYRYDLERFHKYLSGDGKESIGLKDVTPDHIREYMEFLQKDHGYKATTLSRVVASVRVFFDFCLEQELIDTSPAKDVHRPKLPKKLPIYLIEEEVRKLLTAVDTSTWIGRRDLTMLITMVYTGVRLQELVGLDTLDVDFSRETIKILGKGNKERLVPMNRQVREALELWLNDAERKVADGERALFTSSRGRRLSGRSVQYMVDRYVERAGIDKERISPHKLRHTFATLLHGRDVDLVDIQALMGHASIASTQIYTHTDAGRLQSAIDRLGIGD